MYRLGVKGRKWLLSVHIFFSCMWAGAGICLIGLAVSILGGISPQAVPGINVAMKIIDDFIIIPAAFGALLSGLIFSLWTHWGFFKHYWVIIKWIGNFGGILFGTFWLGPWVNGMVSIAMTEGAGVYTNAAYLCMLKSNVIGGGIQVSSLVFLIFVSVMKPWAKRKN